MSHNVLIFDMLLVASNALQISSDGLIILTSSDDAMHWGYVVETQLSRMMLLWVTLFATPINAPQAHE